VTLGLGSIFSSSIGSGRIALLLTRDLAFGEDFFLVVINGFA
jgi:hypothetical protein